MIAFHMPLIAFHRAPGTGQLDDFDQPYFPMPHIFPRWGGSGFPLTEALLGKKRGFHVNLFVNTICHVCSQIGQEIPKI